MSSKWRSSYDSANCWDEFYQRDGFDRATLYTDTASALITFIKTEVSAQYLLCSAMLSVADLEEGLGGPGPLPYF